jgi:lysyl-tRNA synthetase, class II
VHRLERSGYATRVIPVREIDAALAPQLRAASAEWRGRQPERGFTMAMDGLFSYPDCVIAVAEREDGKIGGFIHLVPVPASGGYSLATMRRRRDAPNGLMEFLLVRTIEWARERGVAEVSLNFSVFGEVIRDARSRPRAILRFALLRFDRLFQIDRLLHFNRKFAPERRRRYICFESKLDFPLVGFAYLRAESLLTPPGPWLRTPDLASH